MRMTGEKPKELEFPPVPPLMSDVYGHYSRLKGVADLTHAEIAAYMQNYRVSLSTVDIDLVRDLTFAAKAAEAGTAEAKILRAFGWQD